MKKKGFWRVALGIAGWTSLMACLALSTFSWFTANTSYSPNQATSTKAVQTNAKVYQNNTHSNDDSYQTSPTNDQAGTLSYDHAKGGKATNYYIQQYSADSGGSPTKTLQMYTNHNNASDKAVYYNIKFPASTYWEILDASTGALYNQGEIADGEPIAHTGSNRICITNATKYYDVYLNPSSKIWFVEHVETTTSAEMGNETGYYIYGTAADSASSLTGHGSIVRGIPMYVNAAPETSDKAFYTGLRLSAGDVLYLASGDSGDAYTDASVSDENLLQNTNNASAYDPSTRPNGYRLSFNTTTGAITCNLLGYYSVALNQDNQVHITEWDGYEVDGSTIYKDGSGGSLGAKQDDGKIQVGGTTRKNASATTSTQTVFFASEGSGYTHAYIWKSGGSSKGPTELTAAGDGNFGYYFNHGISGATNMILTKGGWTDQTGNLTYSDSQPFYSTTSTSAGSTTAPTPLSTGSLLYFKSSADSWTEHAFTYNSSTGKFSYTTGWLASGTTFGLQAKNYRTSYNGGQDASGITSTISARSWGSYLTGSSNNFSLKAKYKMTITVTAAAYGTYGNWLYGTEISFTAGYDVSFAWWNVTNNTSVSGPAAAAQTVASGGTLTFPSVGDIPVGYTLYNSSTPWCATTGTGGTKYAVNGTVTVSANKTYYALLNYVPCTVNYYVGSSNTPTYTQDVTQGQSFTVHALPSTTGYTYTAWSESRGGSASATYVAGNSATAPSSTTLNLYTTKTEKSYTYYFRSSVKGWGTPETSVTTSALYTAGSVTFSNVSLDYEEEWKIYRPAGDFGAATWWGYSRGLYGDTSYFTSGDDDNIKAKFAGTYNVSINLSNNRITLTMVSLAASNFNLYQADADNSNVTNLTDSQSGVPFALNGGQRDNFTTKTTVTFVRGKQYFIQGPDTGHGWGYNNFATSDKDYFITGTYDADFDVGDTILAAKANFNFTAKVTFDFSDNLISLSNITISSNYYIYEDADGDGSGYAQLGSAATTGGVLNSTTVTFSNVALKTDDNWFITHDGNGEDSNRVHSVFANFDLEDDEMDMLGVNVDKDTYFYQSDSGGDNISTGYGGTYNITVNAVTGNITEVSCTALNKTDFQILTNKGGSTNDAFSNNPAVTTGTATLTQTGFHLYISEELWFQNDNGGRDSGSSSCRKTFSFGSSLSYNLGSYSDYFYISGGHLRSRVDATISFTFAFDAATTNATFTITAFSERSATDISFNHAQDAGIYVETSNSNTFASSTKKMMHTTSGVDAQGNTYLAQEAPIYSTGSTFYMRIFQTHSNGTKTTPTSSNIREYTEYYFVTQDSPQTGFATSNSNTPAWIDNDHHEKGVSKSEYITVTAAAGAAWTVSLRDDGRIHIEQYSGAQSVSVEHEVPYYLIGKGMPGSDIRQCDFSLAGGLNLYTYGNNSSNVPCYVGADGYANATAYTNDSNKGAGIDLKNGDKLAISSTSGIITTVSVGSSGATASSGTITINASAHYYIWVEGSVGSETVNIAKGAAGSDWTRSGNLVAENGANLIASSGNALTFGANLDYSLLDATASTGYVFYIELEHVSTTGGTMTYTISNGASSATVSIDQGNGSYASGPSYGGEGKTIASLAANGSNSSLNRSISNGTTYTCLRVTLTPEQIRSMIQSGNYTLSLTIACSFQEDAIA